MKIGKIILAAVLSLGITTAANAAWVARAESPSAWGVGYSMSLEQAKYTALTECAVRTPSYQACYITEYYWVD